MNGEYITVARVAKTQGRVGEVAAEILTDFPERFADRRRLFLLLKNGERRELHLDDFWSHKNYIVLKFAGIDSINDAEPLIGAEVQIPSSERASLEEGAAYVSDLVGCRVFVRRAVPEAPSAARSRPPVDFSAPPPSRCAAPAGDDHALDEIGSVTDVMFGTGEAPILVIHEGSREHLVPLAKEYIRLLDTANHRIELTLPEGLLELDAPLSTEEKDEQKNSGS